MGVLPAHHTSDVCHPASRIQSLLDQSTAVRMFLDSSHETIHFPKSQRPSVLADEEQEVARD